MIKRGVEVKGFNTAFAGDVPLGAGMSSSAALESTYAYALNDLFGDNKIDKFELAKLARLRNTTIVASTAVSWTNLLPYLARKVVSSVWIAVHWNTSTSHSSRKATVWYW